MTSYLSSPLPILVVDDVEQNLTAAAVLPLRPGSVVLKASSGAAALEMLLVHEVALALIDVQMPGMDGFELAELIRGSERTRAIPLIFLTAATREQGFSFRGYEAGAVDFLFKPVNGQALVSKVNVFVELYQQKQQLSQQLDELKHALHLNEMFTAVLGHDLRTPLSVVMNGATLLPMMTEQPKVVATAARIEASARRMARMVDQLLDLARMRSGTMHLNAARHDYAALCRLVAEEFEQPGRASRIALSCRGDVSGEVDAGLFSQVISNLLCNALYHGQPDAPVRLNINGSMAGSIEVSVSNLGVIPPAVLLFIFEPFHQGDDSRKSSQGLGLGLYTVSMFVKAHGATVAVTSAEPQGTLFTVVMPRKIAI